MTNGNLGPVKPDDPNDLVRWTAEASGEIRQQGRTTKRLERRIENIERGQDTIRESLAVGVQRFADIDRRITSMENTLRELPEVVGRAVERAMKAYYNGNDSRGKPAHSLSHLPAGTTRADENAITFKWLVQAVFVPITVTLITAVLVARIVATSVVTAMP